MYEAIIVADESVCKSMPCVIIKIIIIIRINIVFIIMNESVCCSMPCVITNNNNNRFFVLNRHNNRMPVMLWQTFATRAYIILVINNSNDHKIRSIIIISIIIRNSHNNTKSIIFIVAHRKGVARESERCSILVPGAEATFSCTGLADILKSQRLVYLIYREITF